MIVGIPKEIKNNENRVSLTPAGAHELVQRGHTVYIQHTAGINSGFSDEEYEKVGARILPTIKDVYAIAEMIIKVKEPITARPISKSPRLSTASPCSLARRCETSWTGLSATSEGRA